jgi:hypothetical protein
MSSAANLAWLRQTGRRYIIGVPKVELRKFAVELAAADGWHAIRDGIEVKLAPWPETGEKVILCRSADRRNKERAMHDKFGDRIGAALAKLAARIERSRKRLNVAQVNRHSAEVTLRDSAVSFSATSARPRASRSPCRRPIAL